MTKEVPSRVSLQSPFLEASISAAATGSSEIKMVMQKVLDEIDDGIVELDEEEVLKELEMVIRVVSEDPNTIMEWRSGEGWKWNFKDNIFIGDLNDLKKGLAYCLGIAVHEAGHIRATRISYYINMWREPGFSGCVNWIEDNRCELSGIAALPGGREWVAGSLETNSEAGGGFNYTDARDAAQGSLGYVPKHVQLGCEIRKYCFRREYAQDINSPDTLIDEQLVEDYLDKIPDDSVKEAMKKIAKDTEEFWQLHPPRFADKETIEEYAKKSSILLKQSLWPVYKELFEEAVDDQSLAKLLEDMLRGAGEVSGEPQIMVVPMDALPADVQKEIIDKLQEQGGSSQSGEEDGDGEKDSSQQQEGGTGSGSSESNDNETSSSASSQNQTSGQQAGQSEANSSSSSSQQNGEKNNPWGDLSDNAKEAIKDVFEDKLTGEQKDQYKEGAQQDITKADDAASEKLRGRNDSPDNVPNSEEMGEDEDSSDDQTGDGSDESDGSTGNGSQPGGSEGGSSSSENNDAGENEGSGQSELENPESNSENKEENQNSKPPNPLDSRKETRRENQEARKKAEEMMAEASKAKEEFSVNKFIHIMRRPHVKVFRAKLKRRLEKILEPVVRKNPRYSRSSGKPNLRKIIKSEVDLRQNKVFERKGQPTKLSVRIFQLGDQSASMGDFAGQYKLRGVNQPVTRMERVAEIFFPFLDILNKKDGVETGLGGFTDGRGDVFRVHKGFKKNLTADVKKEMAYGLLQVFGGTPLYDGIKQAYDHLKKRNKEKKMEHNVLIILTDGRPNGMSAEELKEKVRSLIADPEVAICALGVGEGTDYVNECFPQLHPEIKQKIMKEVFNRRVTKVEAEKIQLNSFTNFETASVAAAIIFEATIKTPEYF